jgi:hypothetical protein
MMAPARPTKVTFAEMRESGVRGILICCGDYRCRPLDGDQRRPLARRSSALGHRGSVHLLGLRQTRGADVRPDFNWDRKPVGAMGYR